jgi:hypothetical protein
MGPLRFRSRPADLLLDDAASYNLVSQRLIRELDIKPIKDATLLNPYGF